MRFTKNAVAASVAGSCPLVAEVTSSNGRHRGTYIIDPAPIQFYDLQGSGKKPHFQVHENQVPVIEAILVSQGFVKADSNEEAAGYYAEGLPFFRHLSNDVDHFLPDLTVINNFDDNEYLLSLVALIDAKGMAQRLYVDDYESASGSGRDAANKRGNLLLSAGYCAMDQTDRSVVQGMNFPKRTKATSRMSGLNGDRTMEETMFKHGCRVVEISDYITFNHPYEGSTMAERVFSDEERNKSFGTRWAVELAVSDELLLWRPMGEVLGGSGEGFDSLGARSPDAISQPDRIDIVYSGQDGVSFRLGTAWRAAPSDTAPSIF